MPRGPAMTAGDLQPALDAAVFAGVRELLAADGAISVGELVEAFVASAEARLSTLRQVAGAGRVEPARMAAHALAGSSRALGAHGMARICHRIEELAGAGCTAEVMELVEALGREFGRVRSELRALSSERAK